jgi:hypothetical protein
MARNNLDRIMFINAIHSLEFFENNMTMNEKLNITICPTYGGGNIRKVRRIWKGEYQGKTFMVPSLEFFECPDCHEKIYDHQAMRKIEAHSPAYAKSRKSKEPAIMAK